MIKIAPSILSADFSDLGNEIKSIENSGADMVHIDVMDGEFVPNITIGPPVIKALRKITKLPFDVHLMIKNPDKFIENFVDAGADIITVHVENNVHLHRTIQNIKQHNVKAAVALNPATSLSTLDFILEELDMVLLMSVNPGFGGQRYISSTTNKIKILREIMDSKGLNIDIQVDGGINTENVSTIINAGANIIVSGSTIFSSTDKAKTIEELRLKRQE